MPGKTARVVQLKRDGRCITSSEVTSDSFTCRSSKLIDVFMLAGKAEGRSWQVSSDLCSNTAKQVYKAVTEFQPGRQTVSQQCHTLTSAGAKLKELSLFSCWLSKLVDLALSGDSGGEAKTA